MIISLIKKFLFIGLVISWIIFFAYIQGGAKNNTLASRVVELLKNDSLNHEPFVTTWKTDMPDQEWKILYPKNIAFFLPKSFEYDFLIDWGDGNKERIRRGRLQEEWNILHEYNSPGVYTVTISGKFPTFRTAGGTYKPNSPDNLTAHKLLTVEKWWTNKWEMLNATFLSANNMKIMATDIPNLSQVDNMSFMFELASSFNQPIWNWDVSNVTDMKGMFHMASSFNQPLWNWDVSNVTDMKMMFNWADAFNQPLWNWNVSNVTNMELMFSFAKSFNQPLWNWDVSNITNMKTMFAATDAFNQPIWNWDVSNVRNMSGMFHRTSSFNQPISNWNVSNATNMSGMFDRASSFNQPIWNWNISKRQRDSLFIEYK